MRYEIHYHGGPLDGQIERTYTAPVDRLICQWDDTEYELQVSAVTDKQMVLIARPMAPA